MFGIIIESGLADWQIVQQEGGYGTIRLSGTFQVPQAALEVGTEIAYPVVRVLSEEDNSQIIPWRKANRQPQGDGMRGTWDVTLEVPAGGLYRIETGLDTKSTKPDLGWIFRGDVRLHIGIGDIFIVAGQSNSAGYGKDPAYDGPDINIHLLRNRGSWDLACHPINESTYASDKVNVEMGVSGTSPYISFGKAYHKRTLYPVGLVTAALGGSPISRWDVNQQGDLYRNMLDRIKECGGKAAGILWYQGCSDTTPELARDYYANFERLVKETRKDIGYEIPFFTFQLNRQVNADYNETWGILREAQRLASHNIPKVYVLPTLHCSMSDGIHNSSHASIMLGENLARVCTSVLYHQPEYLAPDICNAVCGGNILRITFANMKRGFVIITGNPRQAGFLVRDLAGIVPVKAIAADKSNPNVLELTLERALEKGANISFGWEADPGHNPFLDEVTYMPPLAFYEYPVQLQ
ncbi:MAG TPA: sialate O-acetylesterase [Clostridiales bacterium]|nr:sialate O-acetylesterase [Clostridiales bacterium]